MWLDTFNEMRKQSGMSLDELCEKSGIPKGTLSKITSGVTKSPSLDTMKTLVYAMGYTLKDLDDGIESSDTLSKEERSHIKKYRSLDPYGREAVDSILDVEWRRCRETEEIQPTPPPEEEAACVVLPFFHQPSSAGPGQPFNDERPEEIHLKKDPPKGSSYITVVSGRSMEPTYNDGDLIFVSGIPEIRKGQIGIFFMNDQQYVKELGDGVLISHNKEPLPEYAPKPFTEGIRCQGLVLGVCDESYLE